MSDLTLKHNRYAGFKYNLDKKYDAGIVLKGADVKAIRANHFDIKEAFVREDNGELYLWNIIFFDKQNDIQKRKLLLHRNEIEKIKVMLKNRKIHGYVTSIRFNEKNKVKVEIGVGTTKKVRDKRTADKRTTNKRELEKEIKEIY